MDSVEIPEKVEQHDRTVSRFWNRLSKIHVHTSSQSFFKLTNQTIQCSGCWQSFFIDKELTDV